VLPVVASAFRGGLSRDRSAHVAVARGVEAATIRGLRRLPYQLDGDYIGEVDHIELRWCAEVLSLVTPIDNHSLG